MQRSGKYVMYYVMSLANMKGSKKGGKVDE